MNKPAVLLRKINNLLACSLPRSLPSRYFRQSALGIWIPDSQGIQMVESCLAVEWSINQTAFEQRTKFCPLFRQSPFKFWSTIQITIQTVDVLNSRHLFVHYLNVSVIRMSSIRIPTVSEFLFLTRAEIHQVRLSKFSTCRFFIEKLPKKIRIAQLEPLGFPTLCVKQLWPRIFRGSQGPLFPLTESL